MTENKPIIINGVDVSGCKGYYFSPTGYHSCQDILQINDLDYEQDTLCEQNPNCYFKQLACKTQECEELKEYHNKCCEEFEDKKKELLEKYNQLSRDFYNGKYCNLDKCKQLQIKTQECEELKDKLNSLQKM